MQATQKAKRIRLTLAEIRRLPPEYQHEIRGAIRVLEIQNQAKKNEGKSA